MTTQVQISTIALNSDFKVNMETGEAFISQRKTAEITGVPAATIRDWLKADREKSDDQECPRTYMVNENNQLDAKSLQKLVLSAHVKGYEKCADLMEKLMEAGATAFICHMAGIHLQPKVDSTLPQTHIQAVEAYLITLKTVEAQEKRLGIQQKVIDHKNIKTDCSDTHFTIKRVRALNQGMKIDPKILLKASQHLKAEVESVYGHYDQAINQYSRDVWEEAYPDAILPE